MTNRPVRTICAVLGISRSTAYRQTKARPKFYRRTQDEVVLEQIHAVIQRRATYGHRRVRARVNRLFGTRYNRKRIRRVMRIHGLESPPKTRRRTGRAHTGKIATEQADVRWSSDVFEIACWNAEIVQVGFAFGLLRPGGVGMGGRATRSDGRGHPPAHEPRGPPSLRARVHARSRAVAE
jgi:transposase InsO family protein